MPTPSEGGWLRETKRRPRVTDDRVGAFTRGTANVLATHRTTLLAGAYGRDWSGKYAYGRKAMAEPAKVESTPAKRADTRDLASRCYLSGLSVNELRQVWLRAARMAGNLTPGQWNRLTQREREKWILAAGKQS